MPNADNNMHDTTGWTGKFSIWNRFPFQTYIILKNRPRPTICIWYISFNTNIFYSVPKLWNSNLVIKLGIMIMSSQARLVWHIWYWMKEWNISFERDYLFRYTNTNMYFNRRERKQNKQLGLKASAQTFILNSIPAAQGDLGWLSHSVCHKSRQLTKMKVE